jgi:hypothetical protein
MLAAAIAGPAMLLLSTSAAHAQYPVRNGNANDANNRVGSGGRNEGGAASSGPGLRVTPGQIVYGNVNDFKSFRGPVGSTDARSFRGDTGFTASDRFIRDSSGGYDSRSFAEQFSGARPYYGESRGVAAPVGYRSPVSTVGNAYTQAPQFTGQPLNAGSLATLQTGEGLVPHLGTSTTILGGPTDMRTGLSGSYFASSPLGGVHQLTPDQVSNYILPGELPPGPANTGDRFKTNSQFLDKVRSEMNSQDNGQAPVPADQNRQGPNGAQQAPTGQQPLIKPLQTPEAPQNTPLSNTGPSVGGTGVQPLNNGIGTGESIRRNYTVPTRQNDVMTELEKRLKDAQGNTTTTDQQAAQELRNVVPIVPSTGQPATRPGFPLPSTPGGNVPATPGGAAPATPGGAAPAPGGAKVDPMVIDTFSKGVGSPTLAAELKDAEASMRQGKFADAIQKFSLAQEASPNDPMIALGRANAELGAGNYRTAEMQLRMAYGTKPALLMGKYDLKNLIGQERVDTISKDLTDLAAKEKEETMAPFLLAYIDYNTGKDSEAAAQLNDIVKREAGTADPVVKSMMQRWNVPATNQNK